MHQNASLLPTSEGLHVEFKTSFNEDVIETLVAFANAKGGTVYIGIADNGDVKGINIGKETVQNWINEVKNKTTSQIIPDFESFKKEHPSLFTPQVNDLILKTAKVITNSFSGKNKSESDLIEKLRAVLYQEH